VFVQPDTANPMTSFMNSAAVVAERAFHSIIFGFLVQAGFVHASSSQTKYCNAGVIVLFPHGGFHPLRQFQGQMIPGIYSSCRDTPGLYTPRQPERYHGFCRQDSTAYSTTL
jgi:hypothetical protein